jgi:hypothetical protein
MVSLQKNLIAKSHLCWSELWVSIRSVCFDTGIFANQIMELTDFIQTINSFDFFD